MSVVSRRTIVEAMGAMLVGSAGMGIYQSAQAGYDVSTLKLPPVPGLKDFNGLPTVGLTADHIRSMPRSLLIVMDPESPECLAHHERMVDLAAMVREPLYAIVVTDRPELTERMMKSGGNPYRGVGWDKDRSFSKGVGVAKGRPNSFVINDKFKYKCFSTGVANFDCLKWAAPYVVYRGYQLTNYEKQPI